MKKILITSVFLGLALSSYSQLKYFFPDSNAYFSVSWMKFWFQGDTIIENMKYKKVYWQTRDSIADFKKTRYFAAMREDTIAEKVYYVPNNYYNPQLGTEEYLLYNFSVNVGDTVWFYSLWGGWTPYMKERVVKSIDSILIDNHYRKRINFEREPWGGLAQEESWMEGIGTTNGLFFPGYFDVADIMDRTELLCVHIDEKIIYQIYNYCYRAECGGSIDENKNEIFKIYPTIVNEILYIETEKKNLPFNYQIINAQGQIMISGMITSNIINVSNLATGVYLIMVSDNTNERNIKIQKFVKH